MHSLRIAGCIFFLIIMNLNCLNVSSQPITVSGLIGTDTTWKSDQTIYVSGDIVVDENAILRIEPGCTIQLENTTYDIVVKGALLAQGTSNLPIVFEPHTDVSHWGGIRIESHGNAGQSILEYVSIKNAGSNYYSNTGASALFIDSASPVIQNCIIVNSNTNGIQLHNSTPWITNCSLEENSGNAIVMNVDSEPFWNGNTATDNQFNGIAILGGITTKSNVWRSANLPYLISGDVVVDSTFELTIESGNILQFKDSTIDLHIKGTLQSIGTEQSPIIFTSLGDSIEHSWGGLLFGPGANQSVMEHCQLRFGGSNYYSNSMNSIIRCQNAAPTFKRCRIENSHTYGMSLIQSNANLDSIHFEANSQSAVYMDVHSFPVLSNISAQENQYDMCMILSGTLSKSGRWDYVEIPYLIAEDITIPTDVTLTVDPGQEIFFQKSTADLNVKGTLIAQGTETQPILFTSLTDTSESSWGGILFSASSDQSILEHCQFRFGGSNYYSSSLDSIIRCENSAPTFTRCRIENSISYGMSLIQSNSNLNSIHFEANTQSAAYMDVHSFPVLTNISAQENKYDMWMILSGTLSKSGQWDYVEIPYLVAEDITVPTDITLTVNPGQEIFFLKSSANLTIGGTFLAQGTETQPVLFSSLTDTNESSWGGLLFSSGSDESVMEYCHFRFGGSYYYSTSNEACITCDNASPRFNNCYIYSSFNDGMNLFDSKATIERCIFEQCRSHAIRMDANSFPYFERNEAHQNKYNVITVRSGALSHSGRWDYADLDYNLEEDVTIAPGAHLSIDPGNTIRFQTSSTDLIVYGSLEAIGALNKEITFTSLNSQTPHAYGGIYLNSTIDSDRTRFEHCIIEYGGSAYYSSANQSMLFCDGCSPVIRNCIFQYSGYDSLWVANGSPVIENVDFRNSRRNAVLITNNSFPFFHNIRAGGNLYDSILIIGNEWSASGTWSAPGIPYRIESDVTILKEGRVAIAPNSELQFSKPESDLLIQGELNCNGTEIHPIVFTSTKVNPSPGSWGSLCFTPESTGKLNYCTVEYGGSNYYSSGGKSQILLDINSTVDFSNVTTNSSKHSGLIINASNTTIRQSVIQDNNGYGIQISDVDGVTVTQSQFTNNGSAVYANGNAGVLINNCLLTANGTGLETGGDQAEITFGENQFSENGRTGYVNFKTAASSLYGNRISQDQDGLIVYNGQLSVDGYLHPLIGGFYQFIYPAVVTEESSLNVRPDTYIAFQGPQAGFNIYGYLGISGQEDLPIHIAASPTVNNPTQSALFRGIHFYDQGHGNIRNALFRNAGAQGGGAIETSEQSNVIVEGCRFEYNSIAAKSSGESELQLAACQLKNNGMGLENTQESTGTVSIELSQIVTNQIGVQNNSALVDVNARYNWWGDASGPSGMGPGTGDSVSDRVLYDPWLTAADQASDAPLETYDALIDTSYTNTISQYGWILYHLQVEEDRNLLCKLTGVSQNSVYHLIGSYGSRPTLSTFSERIIGPQIRGIHELLIPETKAGDYYILIFAETIPDQEETFQIQFEYVERYILSMNPKQGGNNGTVTIDLKGANLQPGMSIKFIGPQNNILSPDEIYFKSTNHVFFQITASNGLPGEYDLHVTWPIDFTEEVFPASYQMIQGIGPRLEAKLSIPDVIRPGRKYALHIEYENTGDADLIAPFLTIRGSEKTMIGLSPDQDLESIPLQLLAIPSEVPSGVLPPGSKGTIPIYFQPPFMNQIEFQLDVLTDFDEEINWDEMYPAYADSIRERIGSTWGDFHRALAAEATELWRQGVSTYDISILRKRLMDRILLKPFGEISGIVVNNQYGHPQSNLTVLLTSASGEEYSAIFESITDTEGRFHFKNAPADTYTIQCAGYTTVTPEQITLLENEILHDLVLQVPYGGVIEGTVFQSTNRAPIENVYIQLQGPNETSDSTVTNEKGVYRFSSLEPGQYSVQATATAFASIRHEGIQLWAGQVIREVDFLLKEGISLSGAVRDAITENRIPNPIVTAKNSVGLQFTAQTSDDGSFIFSDLAEGIYSLQCFAQGYQMKEQKEIQLESSDSTSIDFVLSRAVSTQGQVLSESSNESIADATVSFFNLISHTGNSTRTDSNGNFTISDLTPGLHYIWVEAHGYLTSYKLAQIDESTQNQSILFLMEKGSALQGHVYDADGKTISDCIVYVENENGVDIASVKTVDGAYQLDAIPRGNINIIAVHEDLTFPVHSMTLDSNEAQWDFIASQHRLTGSIINGSTTQTMTETIVSAIPVMSQRDQTPGNRRFSRG